MRTISRRMFQKLIKNELEPIDLLEIQLAGASDDSVIRLTNAAAPVTLLGHGYAAANFSRSEASEIVASDSGNSPSMTVTVSNVTRQMAVLLNRYELDRASVTLRAIDRSMIGITDEPGLIVAMGEIHSASLSESTFIFEVVNTIGTAESIVLPKRIHQSKCNALFGSASCGVNIGESPFSVTTTTQTGTNEVAIVVESSVLELAGETDPTEYWENGFIYCLDGDSVLQARPIQSVNAASNTFFVRRGFLSPPGVGIEVMVRRGCPKTEAACTDRQGDFKNFGGFPVTPSSRFLPVVVAGH